ncbi:hypothetical protein ACLMJK_000132 [Lecanora helva]
MLSQIQLGFLTAFLASTTLSASTAKVLNSCTFDIYYRLSDSTSQPPNINTISANGGTFTEAFDTNPGRSIQLSTDQNSLAAGQSMAFEYTVSGSTIYYDLSTVTGSPFASTPLQLSASDSSCPAVGLGPAYQNPSGQGLVKTCNSQTDLTLLFC